MTPKKNPWYLLPALIFAVNVFWVLFVFLPMRRDSQQLSERLDVLREKTQKEIPEPEIRHAQGKVDSLIQAAASVEKRLFPETGLLELGDALDAAGSRFGLRLVSVAPQYDSLSVVVGSREPIHELPLKIEYEGTFGDLTRYLDQASGFPFILKMSGISIKKTAQNSPDLSIQISGGVVIKKEQGGQP
jgi:Tfp pilus assembly protein PilO